MNEKIYIFQCGKILRSVNIGMYRMPQEGEITNVAALKIRKKSCGRASSENATGDEHGGIDPDRRGTFGNDNDHTLPDMVEKQVKNFYQFPERNGILWVKLDYG